jgi:hypothetical protein
MNAAFKTVIRSTFDSLDRTPGIRAVPRVDGVPHPLEDHPAIEPSWAVSRLQRRRCTVLHSGCLRSPLTGIPSRLGRRVTAAGVIRNLAGLLPPGLCGQAPLPVKHDVRQLCAKGRALPVAGRPASRASRRFALEALPA